MAQAEEALKTSAAEIEKFMLAMQDELADTPERLKNAMRYSLMAGGKRIRPALCMFFAGLNGLDKTSVLSFACAIEMIHTYSLIHDDLPAMDDDDLRRGKPSNHVAFDEATAILAGDGLLTNAFYFMARTRIDPGALLRAIGEFAWAAGSCGMVGGQMLDMIYTGRSGVTFEEVVRMQRLKTGAILEASCACGAILAQAAPKDVQNARSYGASFGRAFQIVDDILDVTGDSATLGKPAGSDEKAGKNTCPSHIGLDASRKLARKAADEAIGAISGYSGPDASILRELATYVCDRIK